MFDSILLPLAIAVFVYIAYLIAKAYMPGKRWVLPELTKPSPMVPIQNTDQPGVIRQESQGILKEGFQQGPPLNGASGPAIAPTIQQDVSDEEPRVVSPGGPAAPNAEAPRQGRVRSPEATARDPYDHTNTEVPISDTMRHPELSFGPGVENVATTMNTASGVSSQRGASNFSPEFAQNGGSFMGSVLANDLTQGNEFATF
jgi:hypothetical protein